MAIGLGISAYLHWWIFDHVHGASIIDDHIVYYTEDRHSGALGLAYLAATGSPGCCRHVALFWYWAPSSLSAPPPPLSLIGRHSFPSGVFFAVAASAVILWHLEQARSQRLPGTDTKVNALPR